MSMLTSTCAKNLRIALFAALLLAIPLVHGDEERQRELGSISSSQIAAIDKEIALLTSELNKYRLRSFNEEMKAQPYMLEHWHSFSQELKLSEEDQERVLAIKARLQFLQTRRQALIDSQQQK